MIRNVVECDEGQWRVGRECPRSIIIPVTETSGRHYLKLVTQLLTFQVTGVCIWCILPRPARSINHKPQSFSPVVCEHGASEITNNLLQGKSKTVIILSTLCAQF